jgi:hypothetical protein
MLKILIVLGDDCFEFEGSATFEAINPLLAIWFAGVAARSDAAQAALDKLAGRIGIATDALQHATSEAEPAAGAGADE